MPRKDPKDRDYRREYQLQKERGEHEDRMERQRARRAFDSKYGRDTRRGKDISHKKPLSRGGDNSDGYRLENPSSNRARGGAMSKPYTKTKKSKK